MTEKKMKVSERVRNQWGKNEVKRLNEHTPDMNKLLKNIRNGKKGTQKVVLLGTGGFNPCHHMHIRMFELAKNQFQKEGQIEVVGCFISPSHDKYLSQKLENEKAFQSAEIRSEILRIEIEESSNSDWLWIDYWEQKCLGFVPHFTILYNLSDHINDTLKKNGIDENVRCMYLGGRDLWLRCNGHKYLQTPEFGFVMIERNDTSQTSDEYYKSRYKELISNRGPHLFVIENPDGNAMDYSATILRILIRGKKWERVVKDGYLSKKTVEYIKDNNLVWEEEHSSW